MKQNGRILHRVDYRKRRDAIRSLKTNLDSEQEMDEL